MATDMEAVIARLETAVKLEVAPDDELSVQAILSLLPDALTALQAAKAYVDACNEQKEAHRDANRIGYGPRTYPRLREAIPATRAARKALFAAFEDSGVRAMKGETL